MSKLSRLLLVVPLLAGACQIESGIPQEPATPPFSEPPDPVNPIRVDRFVQLTEPVVDVLFVVDNSSSMGDEQQLLADNFPNFINYFVGSGLDYHIALTSTDAQLPGHSGKLRNAMGYNYIDDQNPDPQLVFQAMTTTLGVISGSQESGRAAAYQALELRRDEPTNAGFYRDEAELHIIFVTDADDYSGPNPVTRAEFMSWAANLKTSPDLVTMHAIVGLATDGFCGAFYRPGVSYLQYAAETGGITHSICAPDWDPALNDLGLQTTGLRTEFYLTRVPVDAPELLIEVEVSTINENGQPVTNLFNVCRAEDLEDSPECEVQYVKSRNSLQFIDYRPTPLSEVVVTYHLAEEYYAGVVSETL